MKFPKNNIEDLKEFIVFLKENYSQQQIYLLYGDVGQGKTTFVQYFYNDKSIKSPSFVGYAIYEEHQLLHIDTYFKSDLCLNLIQEYFDKNYTIIIEWPIYENILKYYNPLYIEINNAYMIHKNPLIHK